MNKLLLPLMGIASLGLSACVVNVGDHEATGMKRSPGSCSNSKISNNWPS